MSVFAEVLTAVPVSIAVTILILRYAPSALITLLAGAVAVLTRHSKQGERALAVLRLLRGSPQETRDSEGDAPRAQRTG